MRSIQSLLPVCSLALCALLSACAAPMEPKQSNVGPKLPDPGPDREYQVLFPEESQGATRYIHLTLGDDIAAQCGLVRTHFQFDSAEPLPQDKLVLKALAECMELPKYSNVQLSLVGHADIRGTSGYNVNLAMRRANRVKEFLIRAGVAPERISTSSRGDRNAVGDDVQFSFGYDRRVDANAVGVVHAPAKGR